MTRQFIMNLEILLKAAFFLHDSCQSLMTNAKKLYKYLIEEVWLYNLIFWKVLKILMTQKSTLYLFVISLVSINFDLTNYPSYRYEFIKN